ncbi:hypothetical protein STTU_p0064 (plasmid) [Streptomyces sp. Tu6071]|nr:hypothetical protein STTU_p0064 [Streptomyces sp. Tu6071]
MKLDDRPGASPRVGSTSWVTLRVSPSAEHPRARGLDGAWSFDLTPNAGASPRARARPAASPGGRVPLGSIPARAGSTRSVHAVFVVVVEHPRARGLDTGQIAARVVAHGASPRARARP